MNRVDDQGRRKPSIEELKQHAAETRLRLADDVTALTYKLSPNNLKAEAKEALRERANRAAADVRRSAERAGRDTRDFGQQLRVTARHNPIPTTLIGAGVGWLLYALVSQRRSAPPSLPYEAEARRPPGPVAPLPYEAERRIPTGPAASPRASELKREAMAWRPPQVNTERWAGVYERNPFLIGAAVLGAGLAAAWLIPHSRKEDEWLSHSKERLMGAKDKMLGAAKQQARSAVHQVKHSAQAPSSSTSSSQVPPSARPASEREPRSGPFVPSPAS